MLLEHSSEEYVAPKYDEVYNVVGYGEGRQDDIGSQRRTNTGFVLKK